MTREVTTALAEFRYADAARALYSFAWDDFCSFYVEITKARFAVPEQREVAQRVLAHALDTLLRLLHPMIPFLTEEVWQLLGSVAPNRGLAPTASVESVCIAPWPEADESHIDTDIEQQFAQFQAVMSAVRNIRTENNIPPKESVNFSVRCDDGTTVVAGADAAVFRVDGPRDGDGDRPRRHAAGARGEQAAGRHGSAPGHQRLSSTSKPRRNGSQVR